MSLTLRIEYSNGMTTDVAADTASTTRALDAQDRAEVQVARDDWTSAAPSTPRTAKLYVREGGTREFGGRLDDVQTDNGTATVRINSPEIDAAEAEPTAANKTYQNVGDDTIVTDQVQAVPTLSPGTITQQASAISYSASFASRSKVLYDLRKATSSEFRYNDDWTVDYVDRLGSDKSGSVTLGPAAGNIGDDFSKTEDVRENVTHVQALGAQSGPDQITATATAPSYSSGRKIWRRYENKEVVEQSRLQSITDELVAEYDGEPRALTVECTVYPDQINADLALGDSVFVKYPEEDISRALRITNIMFEWTRRGFLALLTLSNRALTDDDRDTKARDDLQRFNRGYQGFVDRAQAGGDSRQPVTAALNSEASVVYPDDVVSEETARVLVEGLPYRSYSSGGASNTGFGTFQTRYNTVGFAPCDDSSWTTLNSFNLNAGTSQWYSGYVIFQDLSNNTGSQRIKGRIQIDNGTEYIPASGGEVLLQADGGELSNALTWTIPGDYAGSTIDIQARWSIGSGDISSRGNHILSEVHTHPPDPGVSESFNGTTYYPSNCDVLVNGTSMGVSLGNGAGTFQKFVDIGGELTPGVNTVEVTSDSLGHIRTTVETELFRRGETN